jgi:CBS-domain-containing membrane protein
LRVPEPTPRHDALLASVGTAAGGVVAIGLMQLLSGRAAFPLVLVPFATSIVLVMGTPEAEPAQPPGAHRRSSARDSDRPRRRKSHPPVGMGGCAGGRACHGGDARNPTFHLPAGIDPLVVVINSMPWSFLIAPVAIGAGLLAAFAFVWHNLIRRGSWPQRWL